MKKTTKFGVSIFLITLLTLLSLSPKAACITTIGDSSFAGDEGNFYEWIMTDCNESLAAVAGVGSHYNVTIERVYQGPHYAIPSALLVDVHLGLHWEGPNTHQTGDVTAFIAYNNTLNYFNFTYTTLLFAPYPLDMNLIRTAAEALGAACTVNGNEITIVFFGGDFGVFTFNSAGFVSEIVAYENYDYMFTWTLQVLPPGDGIPFGHYYIIFSAVAIGIIAVLVEKRIRFKKNK
ncbi:MAG: hypothetical protein ACFE8V_12065 [Promethearchaeota archaeon]